MRTMNPRAHGLKQRPPSWTIPRLMYAKEIRWLLRSVYIRSQTPIVVKLVERFGNGSVREGFARDQSTSDPLRVNLLSRNIKRNLHM